MRKEFKVPLLICTAAAMAPAAHADVTFHGYGQVVMGTLFSNNRQFPTTSTQGYDADPNFKPDSNFALQATAPLSNSISATAQILARGTDDFQPKFQWAYIKFQLNDTFALKAGRMQTPLYQFSDFQFVGEAYPWVVPPEAVYNTSATNYDGVNLSAQKSVGDWFLYGQAVYGSFSSSNPIVLPPSAGGGTTSVSTSDKNFSGMKLDASYNDWLNFDLAYYVLKLSIASDGNPANPYAQIEGIASYLNAIGAPQAAKDLTTRNDLVGYYTGGMQINYKNFQVIAEGAGLMPVHGTSSSPNFVGEYLSVGYRFNKLLPMITVGHSNWWMSADKIKNDVPAGLTTQVAPDGTLLPFPYPASAIVGPTINAIAGQPAIREKNWYYEATLRYDVTSNVALKLDYTHYDSHWHNSDYPAAVDSSGQPVSAPTDANRLLGAVTFSF
jgi:hypothetical protein